MMPAATARIPSTTSTNLTNPNISDLLRGQLNASPDGRATGPIRLVPAAQPRAGAIAAAIASGSREDDELLSRPGHRDIAVDRAFDARSELFWGNENDQVELEPLR